jgi:hypothetical protein
MAISQKFCQECDGDQPEESQPSHQIHNVDVNFFRHLKKVFGF